MATETKPREITDLSLFDIEVGIHSVVTMWQEAETREQIEEADRLLIELAAAEVQKVDGWRRYMKLCRSQSALAKEESELQASRAALWASRYDRLADLARVVMESFGKKKLEGKTGSILLKGNGGLQPLVISDAAILPDDCVFMDVRIPADRWKLIVAMCERYGVKVEPLKADRVPSNETIRMKLAQPCAVCKGGGNVKQACSGSIDHLAACGGGCGTSTCVGCGGSGTAGVPGAHLDGRGVHIEVK